MLNFFTDSLLELLVITQDDFKTIKKIDDNGNPPLETELEGLTNIDAVHNGIKEFYKEINDGWGVKWEHENYNVGGNIQLAEAKNLLVDPKSFSFYDRDSDENADIRFFHPLDYPSPESYVGFVIRPDTIYKSVYYMSISDYELNNLDLDFSGYTEMAVEARVFNHWQKVLLYYMGDVETGSSETETFKTEMPKIFPDWTWENFIAKFESLRLSNK